MGMKSARAIKFFDLPQVAEIVISPFMEQMRQGNRAEFGMDARASAGGWWKSGEQG